MRLRTVFVSAVAILLLGVGPVSADRFQSFGGNTVNGPTFFRPIGSGPNLTTFPVRYRAQRFVLQNNATCTIYSAQDYDGYVHLYRGAFNPSSPLTNLLEGDDDAELGVGTSRCPANLNQASISLVAGTYTLVTSGFSPTSEGSFQTFLQCNSTVQPIPGLCYFGGFPRDQQLCLHDRFAVKIDLVTNHPTDGRATPVRYSSTDSAFFWFYNDKNYEVMVKVLNGCAVNGHWWVFIAGTTNQGHRIQVGDVTDGAIRTYFRSLGPAASAITDVVAFDCP